jgi:LacI family transcriptional regulator
MARGAAAGRGVVVAAVVVIGKGRSELMEHMRHVALLIETSGSYGRGLLRGVARYNREHGRWSTYFQPHGLGAPPPAWLKTWRGDGILARVEHKRLAQVLRKTDVPVVNLRRSLAKLPFPYVGLDNARVAQAAAEHLLERGLRHFAFCGKRHGANPGLEERGDEFRRIIEAAGFTCDDFDADGGGSAAREKHVAATNGNGNGTGNGNVNGRGDAGGDEDATAGEDAETWEQEQARLAAWIQSMPKPLGVMAANDERGLQVLDACRRCGARVPEDVAVIGADNDEHLCDLSIPPMSSVDVNPELIGYTAAEMLDRMMASSRHRPAPQTLLAPRGVVTRRSTDVLASEDPIVNQAASFIRERGGRGLQVPDVAAHVKMSRASLEPRMKRVLGRTIHQEIQRVQLDRVKELLVGSPMPIKQIAREGGFSCVQYLTRVFRSATGETPARYRSTRQR